METVRAGLSRDPFARDADLDDACLPNTLGSILSELQSGLRAPQGVSVLVGAPGSGKSMAASAFARRLSRTADTVLLEHPTSSASAVARDALKSLSGDASGADDKDWIGALREHVRGRARDGVASVIVVDDASRLSPQALEDLAALFDDDEPIRLYVFLFGRPRLLERMRAGGGRALGEHLLQICRIDPLALRESVRYLERRLAMCGGELATLFSDEAIDEIVIKSQGCLVRLETLAAESLRRSGARGQRRVAAEDVAMVHCHAVAEEEDEEIMAKNQQPLRFELAADIEEEERWSAGDEEEVGGWDHRDKIAVAAGDEDWQAHHEEDDEWEADDAEAEEEVLAAPARGLSWTRSAPAADALGVDLTRGEEAVFGRAGGATNPRRRRLIGRTVLSVAACGALVWAANRVPGAPSDAHHGRDAQLFAGALTSDPSQIMRLAKNAEAADADAHVALWRAQPPRPATVEVARVAQQPDQVAMPNPPSHPPLVAASSRADQVVGPFLPAPAAHDAPSHPRQAAEGGPTRAAARAESAITEVPVSRGTNPTKSTPAHVAAPVYTVQLGAFKTRRNAEDLATKIHGKPTHIVEEGGLFRVMSGSFANRQEAALHEATLKRAGYTTFVRTAAF
ncbi:MAG TPA: AAA family ATPase [Candidatus Binatia bacterium]|jgi:type II secretory pathway predicted ATPase ExeA/cell division protein FtsN